MRDFRLDFELAVTNNRFVRTTRWMQDPRFHLSDAELLRSDDPHDFARFYRRHLAAVVAYVARRLRDPEATADLVGEVFAAALASRMSYDERKGDARAWLCTIAANEITDSVRRGQVRDACRRRLGIEPIALESTDLSRVEEMAAAASLVGNAEVWIEGLPAPTAAALRARVLDEREYGDIARSLKCSESVVRQRVSRGLRELRTALGGES
jgi:RNA polymerase sigma-70 factor (ECF subfamily)